MHHFAGLLLQKAQQTVTGRKSADIQSLYRQRMIRRKRLKVQILDEQVGENGAVDFKLDRKFLRSGYLLNHELRETKENRLVKNDEQQDGDR
jgi:hypothetical protein